MFKTRLEKLEIYMKIIWLIEQYCVIVIWCISLYKLIFLFIPFWIYSPNMNTTILMTFIFLFLQPVGLQCFNVQHPCKESHQTSTIINIKYNVFRKKFLKYFIQISALIFFHKISSKFKNVLKYFNPKNLNFLNICLQRPFSF